MKHKIYFIILLVAVIFIISCASQTKNSSKTPGPSADVTDGRGIASFNVAGKDVAFKFVNENTGEPLQGLSVGFGLGESKSQGLLMVIDPSERVQPQVIILRGGNSMPTAKATADADAGSYVGGPVIPIPADGTSDIIQEIILDNMLSRKKKNVDLRNFTVLADEGLVIQL